MDLGSNILDTILEKLNGWYEKGIDLLPNFVVAVLALLLFIFAAKYIYRGVRKLLDRAYHNTELSRILGRIIQITIILLGVMFALSILHLDKTVTSVLAGAGIVGLALSFAFQDLAVNLVSGFIMASQKPFRVGDLIEVEKESIVGKVSKIRLRTTEVITMDGNEVIVPNRILFENPLINYYHTKTRRVDLEVGISYAEDLEKVEKITVDAIKNLPFLLEGKDVEFIFTGFGDSSINFEVRYWVPYERNFEFLKGISNGIKALKKAYDNEGITIPFPIRTMDFGIKGGKRLDEVLEKKSNSEE